MSRPAANIQNHHMNPNDQQAIIRDWRERAERRHADPELFFPPGPAGPSTLTEMELPQAIRRSSPGRLTDVAAVLARLARFEIDAAVRATAAAYTDPGLRSLDAIHLATADHLRSSGKTISSFVTYDSRLARAAMSAGFTTQAPVIRGHVQLLIQRVAAARRPKKGQRPPQPTDVSVDDPGSTRWRFLTHTAGTHPRQPAKGDASVPRICRYGSRF
jgi:uncharacterized protein